MNDHTFIKILQLAAPVLPPSTRNIDNYLPWILAAFKAFIPLQCNQQGNICATQSYTVSCVIPAEVQRESQPLKDQSDSCNEKPVYAALGLYGVHDKAAVRRSLPPAD